MFIVREDGKILKPDGFTPPDMSCAIRGAGDITAPREERLMSYTVTYTGPKRRVERTGKCPTCGKRVKRSRVFEKTVSPFNRHPDTGLPKTWDEVARDVDADAEAWVPNFEHWTCAESCA